MSALEKHFMQSADYWLGWLAATIAGPLRELRRHDATDTDKEHAVHLLEEGWSTFAKCPLAEAMAHLDEMQWMGFVVESADGEPQAYRDTYDDAVKALVDVRDYWAEAEACGHPLAPSYVNNLRPFTIRQITKAEALELAEFPAVIDREG